MALALTPAKCILLAVDFASNDNVTSLETLYSLRSDALPISIVLRILLTYLPETVPPETYTPLIERLITTTSTSASVNQDASVDLTAIHDVSDADAQARADRTHLLELKAPAHPPNAPNDDLALFLCHRAYRIDQETGLLPLVADLVRPFVRTNDYIRSWYLSIIQPLLRLQYEYYPRPDTALSVIDFEDLETRRGIDLLLANAIKARQNAQPQSNIGRDLRGLVAPWLSGNPKWRRQVVREKRGTSPLRTLAEGHRISLSGNTEDTRTSHDWEYVFEWLVTKAALDFGLVIDAIDDWNGPTDVDFDDVPGKVQDYVPKTVLEKLDKRFAQAMFASCYVVEKDCSAAIDGAHGILVRLAALLDFEPPPELAISVEQLPLLDKHASDLHEAATPRLLQADKLMEPEHALTTPTLPTYMLLQMFVYSAYQFQTLGQEISIGNVARMRFFDIADEQFALLQKIIQGLIARGKRDEQQWLTDRARIVWLWNWNIDPSEGARQGAGVLGRIDRELLERSVLKAMIETANYALVERIYFDERQGHTRLSSDVLEHVILGEILRCYDNATNGNRTRGNMKKASDILSAFQSKFPDSQGFKAASALIAATHALSFYALTLQQGVPFQPANIRASSDPLSLLLPKVLEQNPRSYTKLEDLVSIGQNLVMSSSQLATDGIESDDKVIARTVSEQAADVKAAERKVVYMCIEAALTEDDFDTAYSYLTTRLAPRVPQAGNASQPDAAPEEEPDDMSWRAAFLAGRFRSASDSSTANASPQKTLQRLEKRTELLSLALLLTPSHALTEILSVYRRLEEELVALVAQADGEEDETLASYRPANQPLTKSITNQPPSDMPGEWKDARTEGMVFGQQRREMGRLSASNRYAPSVSASARSDKYSTTSRPSSGSFPKSNSQSTRQQTLPPSTTTPSQQASEDSLGLFDVARGAAAAFSRSAPMFRPGSTSNASLMSPRDTSTDRAEEGDLQQQQHEVEDEHGRVRKRDVVANVVSGTSSTLTSGLASGLGWVLGAPPAAEREGS